MLPGRQPAGALGLSLPVDGNLGLYVMLHRAALIIKGTLGSAGKPLNRR
jgi:hypothetical protein